MEYKRDKRSPNPKNEQTSKVMSANKSKNTKPEVMLRKALWSLKVRGYRLNYRSIPGSPDIVFIAKKVAVFVNGCFWHRCPICNYSLPKTNTEFWSNKFVRNTARDLLKNQQLEGIGWKVIVIWECEIKKDINNVVTRLVPFIK